MSKTFTGIFGDKLNITRTDNKLKVEISSMFSENVYLDKAQTKALITYLQAIEKKLK